jgi:hypothetical protein
VQDFERDALHRNDRYLLEFIEALNLCPFAKGCREGGKLHREVVDLDSPDIARAAERTRNVEAQPPDSIDVALLIFPKLRLDAREFERFVGDVRREHDRDRKGPAPFFLVAFHPEMKQDLANADRAVGFLRRSPDPTIQMVSSAATDRARDAARDGRELSRVIAEAGLRAVLDAGPERLAALLREIHEARR